MRLLSNQLQHLESSRQVLLVPWWHQDSSDLVEARTEAVELDQLVSSRRRSLLETLLWVVLLYHFMTNPVSWKRKGEKWEDKGDIQK